MKLVGGGGGGGSRKLRKTFYVEKFIFLSPQRDVPHWRSKIYLLVSGRKQNRAKQGWNYFQSKSRCCFFASSENFWTFFCGMRIFKINLHPFLRNRQEDLCNSSSLPNILQNTMKYIIFQAFLSILCSVLSILHENLSILWTSWEVW